MARRKEAPDPVPELKLDLARALSEITRDFDQHVAALYLGIDQPRVSDLRRERLERFSLERLIRMLPHVGRRVEMRVVEVGGGFRWYRRRRRRGAHVGPR
jgi:predicted XRE-type DNA-binding protein